VRIRRCLLLALVAAVLLAVGVCVWYIWSSIFAIDYRETLAERVRWEMRKAKWGRPDLRNVWTGYKPTEASPNAVRFVAEGLPIAILNRGTPPRVQVMIIIGDPPRVRCVLTRREDGSIAQRTTYHPLMRFLDPIMIFLPS